MQNLVKQLTKQSKNLIKAQPKNSFFTAATKKINREAYAKQCFALKMNTIFNSTHSSAPNFIYKPTYNFGSFPEHQKLAMPALSPSMERGKILKWNFKEGGKIEIGESICEVETDKSTVGFEATEEMILAKILIPEGQEIEVGHIVAIAVEDAADVAAFKNFTESDAGSSTSAAESKPAAQESAKQDSAPASSGKSYPQHQKLAMPALSPSMEKGKIQKWNVKVGDKVEIGESICEVETDKSTVGFEATEEMYIAKILIPEGEEIEVGYVVAISVDEEADIPAFADYDPSAKPAAAKQQAQPKKTQEAPKQEQSKTQQKQTQQVSHINEEPLVPGERLKVSPLAKNSAQSLGIDLSLVKGSGQGGRIILEDVLNFAKNNTQATAASPAQQTAPAQQQQQQAATSKPASQQQPKQQQQQKQQQQSKVEAVGSNPYIDFPNSNMRKIIASRLLESKQNTPHFQLSIDVNVDNLLKIRSQLNKNEGVKVSVNDFVVKACALALRDFPAANSQWLGDKIRQFKNADISIAVSTDGGLITPIVYEANKKGLTEISAQVKDLAKRARENKLLPQEFQGGTFTISNLGMFGIDAFTAIINPPQACILAVSQSNKKMVYDPSKEGQEVPFSVHNIMNVCMSCDHRVVDGAVGAQFLQKFKFYIENPTNMLL